MSMRQIPALGAASTRYALLRDLGHTPDTFGEIAMETLLTQLVSALQPGRPVPTKASLAELIEASAVIAREKCAARPVCGCGHAWSEHVAGRGCFECECDAIRPTPGAALPLPLLIGADITVTCPSSRYFGRRGLAVGRDGRGLLVKLAGLSERIHFERSEVDAVPRPALTNFYARNRGQR